MRSIIFAILGWFGTAWLVAFAARWVIDRHRLPLSPDFLLAGTIMIGLMLLPVAYGRVWQGHLLPLLARSPGVALDRLIQHQRMAPHLVRTPKGIHAAFRVALPCRTAHNADAVQLRLTPFLAFDLVAYQWPQRGNVSQYPTHEGIEASLRTLLLGENQALADRPGLGRLALVLVVRLPSLTDAEALVELPGVSPFPIDELAKDLLGPLLSEAEVFTGAWGVPAVIEQPWATCQPLLIRDHLGERTLAADWVQDLGAYLERPVLRQVLVHRVTAGERRRLHRLRGLESACPKGLLSNGMREQLAQSQAVLDQLDQACRSAEPPHMVKEICWVVLQEGDTSKSLFQKAQPWFQERGVLIHGVGGAACLHLYASLIPGLAHYAAAGDPVRGKGVLAAHGETLDLLAARDNTPSHEAPLIVGRCNGHNLGVDPFTADNPNVIVVGPSGSGKSVLLNGMLAAVLGRDAGNRAVAVDLGGSFEGLVTAVGGRQYSADRDAQRFSPFPALPPDPGERAALAKQALHLITHHLCRNPPDVTAVLEDVFLQTLNQLPADTVDARFQWAADHAAQQQKQARDAPYRKGWRALQQLWIEARAFARNTPLIGDGDGDLAAQRLTSFNLEGYTPDEQRLLIGLITLQVQQLVSSGRLQQGVILFDEAHVFLRGELAMVPMLAALARVTRKYGVTLILASQTPDDFEQARVLLDNSATHILLKTKQAELGPGWRIRSEPILRAANRAPPVAQVGYSNLFIGMDHGGHALEFAMTYHLTPAAAMLFDSVKARKRIMDLAVALTRAGDYLELAHLILKTRDGPITIGDPTFWNTLVPRIQQHYPTVAGAVEDLLCIPNPPLATLLAEDRELWEIVCSADDPTHELEALYAPALT